MNAYETYCLYLAMKRHFSSEDFDFFKYSGKTNTSVDAFEKRKDKYFFHKLSRTLQNTEPVFFMASNFFVNEKIWTKDLLSSQSMTVYTEAKKRVESISYIFENEFQKLVEKSGGIKNAFRVVDGDHPKVLISFEVGEISPETFVILNLVSHMFDNWDDKITDDIIYPKIKMGIKKYTPFIKPYIDTGKVKKIMKKCLESAPS